MCGILGIVYNDKNRFVNQSLVDGLTVLQHRGQESAGIATINENRFHIYKKKGLVSEVFNQENILNLKGNVGIGHVRYPTSGSTSIYESHPLYTNAPYGIVMIHNGNITNTKEIMDDMIKSNRHINTNSDSELLLNVFAEELSRKKKSNITEFDIYDSVRALMRICEGGFSVIMLINRIGLVAFRDPYGIRPLCFGRNDNGDYAFASESVAIDALGSNFKLVRDVLPGECLYINTNNYELSAQQVSDIYIYKPCLFEYIYFARPDSTIDKISVYEARTKMGEKLANRILKEFPDNDIDVVIPIPETSRISALEISKILNKPYKEGFIKNRYIARTFILPGQEIRKKTVKLKLNTIKSIFKDKNILIVDDSIVRGTTSTELIQLAKASGAKKIYFASAAPVVKYPNVYGIDIPTSKELIANNKNEIEIAKSIGADKIFFNDLDDVIDSCISSIPKNDIDNNCVPKELETSCFNGYYVTGNINTDYLNELELKRK
jgi:amidophosphoribosyltransferase